MELVIHASLSCPYPCLAWRHWISINLRGGASAVAHQKWFKWGEFFSGYKGLDVTSTFASVIPPRLVIKSNLPYLEPGVTYPIIRVNIHCLAASDARDTFSSSSFPNLAPWSPLLTSSQWVIEQKSSLILSMMSRSSPTLPAPIIFVPARTTFDREEVTLQAGAQRQSCKNQGVHFMSAATPS